MDERHARPRRCTRDTHSRAGPASSATTTCASRRSGTARSSSPAKYGIHGFCYYYYWFSGQRLLERPLDLMLADRDARFSVLHLLGERELVAPLGRLRAGHPDGAEAPARRSRRGSSRISRPCSSDPRYIRVDGAPILLVYRPDIIPALTGVLRIWRKTAERPWDWAAPSLRGPELRLHVQPRGRLRCDGGVSAAQHRRRRDHRHDAGPRARVQRQDLLVPRGHRDTASIRVPASGCPCIAG